MSKQTVHYLVRKLAVVLLTLFLVTLLSFLLMRLSPVDPATAYVKRHSAIATEEQIEAARIELGLDKPLPVQYLRWVKDALKGDLGISLGTGKPVTEELSKTVPVTLTVTALCAVVMGIGALLFGSLCYLSRGRGIGKVLSGLAIIGISLPPFYLATVFLDVFAVKWGVISVAGNIGLARFLPAALCLSLSAICFYGQLLSDSLHREMAQDYAFYARCRGLSEPRILICHALPHALVDLLPSFAQMLGLCLAGAAIVERVFSLSGLGYLIIDAVVRRDSPVIHASVLLLAGALVLLDTVAELLQHWLQKDVRAKEAVV